MSDFESNHGGRWPEEELDPFVFQQMADHLQSASSPSLNPNDVSQVEPNSATADAIDMSGSSAQGQPPTTQPDSFDVMDESVVQDMARQLQQPHSQTVVPATSDLSDAVVRQPTTIESTRTRPDRAPETTDFSEHVGLGDLPVEGLPLGQMLGQSEMPLSMQTPSMLPTQTMDFRQLLSDQAAPSVQPITSTRSTGSYYFMPRTEPANQAATNPATYHESFDVASIRNDFPILHQEIHGKPLIWLDNAATTQKPQSVIDAISRYYQRDNSNVHRGAHSLAARSTDAYESARDKVAQFLGASSSDEIVFVRGTTEGINLIAQTWGRKNIGAGDEILVTTLEHHANIVPWQMLAQEKNAVLKVVPVTNRGEINLEEYGNLLGPKTKLVGFTQVSNALGTILPVQEMVTMAHRVGARVLVDGAQSVPHMPVNVQQLGADWFVFSGHKLFAPTGVGAVYGRKEVLEEMPPWQGGGNMIEHVTFEKTTYAKVPQKFEAGTGTLADAVGLGAAIDYLNSIGMERIAAYERTLTEYATEQLAQVSGLRQIGTAPDKASVLSFVIDGTQPEDIARRLDQEGIAVRAGHHCAQPTMHRYGLTGTVRPSLAFYNTHEEVDALIAALNRIAVM